MNATMRSGLVGAFLFLLALMAGCGSSSTSKSVPTVEQAFYVHSVVFDNNSSLLLAGYNGFGQLGDTTLTTPNPYPQGPFGVGPVHGYAAGANHTLAFTNNSTIYAWGSNLHGRLGINAVIPSKATSGTDAFTNVPVAIKMPNTVVSIATGWNHSLAVAGANRSVLAWGANNFGQLGTGINLGDQVDPGPVVFQGGAHLERVVQVAAGGSHSLALTEDGTVYSWGDNEFTQLGYATLPQAVFSIFPQKVTFPGATGIVKQVAAAGSFSAARMDDGTVWVWGYNVYGQGAVNPLGKGFLTAPTQVKNADGTPFLATKIALGTMHVIALRAEKDLSGTLINTGEVWGWGWNEKAQLGLSHLGPGGQTVVEDNSLFQFNPMKATAIGLIQGIGAPFATDIYAFGTVSFARVNGTLYGWGDNGFGQLGKPIPTNSVPLIFIPVEFKRFGT